MIAVTSAPVCAKCAADLTVRENSTARRILSQTGKVAALPFIALIRFYQLVISPLTPPTCRYYPSCSSYALTALRRFGPLKGTWLAIRRVGRCHPWAPGGVDYVPDPPDPLVRCPHRDPDAPDTPGATTS